MIQNSFKNKRKNLFIIPTPIGNMDDISLRSIATLCTLEVLLCEDTRVTGKLLKKHDIKIKLVSYHDFSRVGQIRKISNIFSICDNVGLVSDAGFPLISDPGFELREYCDSNGINVVILPGSTSFILPLIRSGFSIDNFTYYGFLRGSSSEKIEAIKSFLSDRKTSVIFESKHKILKTLSSISSIDPNRMVCVGRELTKINEQYIIDTCENVLTTLQNGDTRGEFVIVIEGSKVKKLDFEPLVDNLIDTNISRKDIAKITSKMYDISKNEVYKFILENYE